jgi:hypothetical protein
VVALAGPMLSACSVADAIPVPQCGLDQVRFNLGVTVGVTDHVFRARATDTGGPCKLSLPVALSIWTPEHVGPIQVDSSSSVRPLLQGNLPGQEPATTWIWTNWCGKEDPPFQVRLSGPQARLLATLRLDAGPPCRKPLRISQLTAVGPAD